MDVYWDRTRQVWSLCPIELGSVNANGNVTVRAPLPALVATLGNGNPIVKPHPWDKQVEDPGHDARLLERVPSSLSGLSTADSTKTRLSGAVLTPSSSPTGTMTTASTRPPKGTAPLKGSKTTSNHAVVTSGGGTLVDVGPYSCTKSTNVDLFSAVLASHLDFSQTNLNATLKYIILNLHAAVPGTRSSTNATELPTEDLPRSSNALSSKLAPFMAKYLYTPEDLDSQRSDLNSSGSWYAVIRFDEPDSAYFHVNDGGSGDSSTPDGWPSESFVEINRAKRVFAGFGHIDSQMQNYNFSADASIMFPSHYLQSRTSVKTKSNGKIKNGCFFDPNENTISSTNNSWAIADDPNDVSGGLGSAQIELNTAANLTLCGISPILNETLGNMTADQEYTRYSDFAQSTIWSWAPGEPRIGDDRNSRLDNRCAIMSAKSGFWQTEDCAERHYSACRHGGQPYAWRISSSEATYTEAGLGCEDESEFSVPRTALENVYLVHTWKQARSSRDIDDDFVWVNFNDIDALNCWVVGQNATCPYLPHMSNNRTVIVPTVAAVIVFVLAALTVFVKCAANRQHSKSRRRRGDDGWDYEGVPS